MMIGPKHNFKRLENFWRDRRPKAKTRQQSIPNWVISISGCQCGIKPPLLMRKHCGCDGKEMTGDGYWVRLMRSLDGSGRRKGNSGKCCPLVRTTSKHGEGSNLSVRGISFFAASSRQGPRRFAMGLCLSELGSTLQFLPARSILTRLNAEGEV